MGMCKDVCICQLVRDIFSPDLSSLKSILHTHRICFLLADDSFIFPGLCRVEAACVKKYYVFFGFNFDIYNVEVVDAVGLGLVISVVVMDNFRSLECDGKQ